MIKRHLEKVLEDYSTLFPVVLLTGARQVGKSTLFSSVVSGKKIKAKTFDSLSDRQLAETDPNLFFDINKEPLMLDEVQYVPSVFSYIKLAVDRNRHNGMYYLTGSQSFRLMENISESLAGRIGILELMGLSIREEIGEEFNEPFIPSREFILRRNGRTLTELWSKIYRGFYPELIASPRLSPNIFFSSYVKTYLERDVRALSRIHDLALFESFLRVLAFRAGNIVNYSDISSILGVSDKTIKGWIGILEQSGIIFHLDPFFGNSEKRVTRSTKLYFSDTGLLCYLLGDLASGDDLKANINGRKWAIFENFVIAEIKKSFINAGRDYRFSFYRESQSNKEIDLFIEIGSTIYPIEIKSTKTPSLSDSKGFSMLGNIKEKDIKDPIVICDSDTVGALSNGVLTIPASWI